MSLGDGQGDVDTGFDRPISVEWTRHPGGADLGDSLTMIAQGGVATFTALTPNVIGTFAIAGHSGALASAPVSVNVTGATSSPSRAPVQVATIPC